MPLELLTQTYTAVFVLVVLCLIYYVMFREE
jgi:hypothetical protein